MNKTRVRCAVGLALALGLASACSGSSSSSTKPTSKTTAGKTYQLKATLDARHVVTPDNKVWIPPPAFAKGGGTLTGTLDAKTAKLAWKLSYRGIGSPQLPIADMHRGKPGQFGAVVVRLCGPCKANDSGTVKVRRSDIQTIVAGGTWVTVIHDEYPNGVIRGQITTR